MVKEIGGENIVKKINGKCCVYFWDTNIFLTSSEDWIYWEVCENEENNQRISILHPRMGYFDSRLVERGADVLYKEEEILLIFNGGNTVNFNDQKMSKFTNSAGQGLFKKSATHRLIDRTKSYFITPDKDYEKVGEVREVCFVEGLVHFKNKWFLYYAMAESKIAESINDE